MGGRAGRRLAGGPRLAALIDVVARLLLEKEKAAFPHGKSVFKLFGNVR